MTRDLKSLLIVVIIISILIGGCGLKGKNNDQADNGQTGEEDVATTETNNNKQDEENNDSEDEIVTEAVSEVLEEYENGFVVEEEDGTIHVYESIVSEEETPYIKIRENGEKVYLSEVSPEVVMLSEAVAEFGKAINEINWETATGKEEYHLLTPEAQKGFEEESVEEMALEFYKTHKIKKRFVGIEKFNSIEFNGNSEAIVDVDYAFMYENVEDLANYKAGKTYYAPEKMRFRLINGKWLMDELLESRQRYSYEEE